MPTPTSPNIVLVLSDEQHLDTLGCYGSPVVRTPHVDRLAGEGMRFTSAWCCSSICSPSRAALFTGLLPHRFGTIVNNLTIPPETPNLAGLLRSQGYRLGYAGKWHVDKDTVPTSHHFEGKDFPGYGYPAWMFRTEIDPVAMQRKKNYYYEYLVENGWEAPTLSDVEHTWMPDRKLMIHGRQSGPVEAGIPYFVGEETVRLIRSMSRRRGRDGLPFFVWANFWGPHNPCYLPEPYFSMYDPKDIPEPPSAGDEFHGKPHVHERMSKYWGMFGAPWSAWREHLARYLGYVTYIDDQIGRMVAALDQAGELDNTLFVFASDHGDMMGRHQLMDKGAFMYDDTYRIPMVVRGPAVQEGVCDEFVYLHDLFETLLDTAGSESIPDNDGRSLKPLLTAAEGWESRDEIFGEFDRQIVTYPQRMIRTRTHKFIYNTGDIGELYDLEKDPHEMQNEARNPAYKDIKEDLKARLLAHLKSTKDGCAGVMQAVMGDL